MKNEDFTEQELAQIERREVADDLAEDLIARAKDKVFVEQIKEEDLLKVPAALREALVMHLLTFEWRPGDGSAQEMMAKQIALAAARVENIIESDHGSRRLGYRMEDNIVCFSALDKLLTPIESEIDSAVVAILLEALHSKVIADIYETLKSYIVIPKNKDNCEVIS